jgi:eukaryotic-like serine/threonine-protein kinase
MVSSSPQGAPIDRYVVLEYLSEGGMGAIYLGKKLGAGGFEKEVVLKQLLPEFTQQAEFIDLFLREARLSATLDHANIIHTIDLVTAGQEYFIVMEYLAGADLRTLLKKVKRRRKRMSAAAGMYIAREVLSALAYAHQKIGADGNPLRLIHRDVSPSNILVSRNGEVKLTDFGIAKASTHNSVFYRVKGKVGYMSPEQAKNEPIDARSDLYSLAVCLYEVITGERLFVHAGLTTSADEIYRQPIPLVSRKVPGLPAELDKLMLKALAIDPDTRYQTAGEFQEALLRCAHKAQLLMSAPELAAHLREVCGAPERWRDLENQREGGHTAAIGGGGTEVFDGEDGTDQIDVSEVDLDGEAPEDSDLISMGSLSEGSAPSNMEEIRARALTSLTNLGRLQGLELTSLISMAPADALGAEPLVNLDDFDSFGDGAARSPSAPAAPAAPAAPPTRRSADPSQSGVEIPAAAAAPAKRQSARQVAAPPPAAAPAAAPASPAAAARTPARDSVRDAVARAGLPREGAAAPRAAAASAAASTAASPRRGRAILIIALIILAGAGTALAIGLSGPDLETGTTPPSPAGSGAPVGDEAPPATPSAPR